MQIRDNNTDNGAIDQAAESIDQLDQQRVGELTSEKQLQEIKHEVISLEAARLAAKHGENAPRVTNLISRSNYNASMFPGLDKAIDQAATKTEPLPLNAWRLNGKVMTKKMQPVPDITVLFSDEKGNDLKELGSAVSDPSGNYSITIAENLIERAQKTTLYISAFNKNGQVLSRELNTSTPTKSIIDYLDLYVDETRPTKPPITNKRDS